MSPHAALSSDAAHSRSARPPCMAVISSTPSPRSAPYHSPNTAPARAAGAASFSPSATDGHDPGSCTDHTRRNRLAPSALATSWTDCGRGAETDRRRHEHEEEHGDRGDRHRATVAPEHDQQARRHGDPRRGVGDRRQADDEPAQSRHAGRHERGHEGQRSTDDEPTRGGPHGRPRGPEVHVTAVADDRARWRRWASRSSRSPIRRGRPTSRQRR